MSAFAQLLRSNRNYRFLWFGQVVSEVGDHFNNIAVMSLAISGGNMRIAGLDGHRAFFWRVRCRCWRRAFDCGRAAGPAGSQSG